MTMKTAYKYQLADHKNSIIIFYFVVLCVITLLFTSITVSGAANVAGAWGLECATVIFLFISGLCSFKEQFLMLSQNGVSRKSLLKSRVLVFITVAFGMAAIDKVIHLIGAFGASLGGEFQWTSMYEQIFKFRASQVGSFVLNLESFLFDACIYMAILAAGYFITIIY